MLKCLYIQKIEPNIPHHPRVMRIFTKRPWSAKMMLGENCHRFAYQWLDNVKYISKQNLNQKYHAVQELWAFSPKEPDWPKWCSMKPRYRFAYRWPDNVKIHIHTKFEQYNHGGQELWAFSIVCRKSSTGSRQSLVHQIRMLCMPVIRQGWHV